MYGVTDNGFAAHYIIPVFVGVWSCDTMKEGNNGGIAARNKDELITLFSDSA